MFDKDVYFQKSQAERQSHLSLAENCIFENQDSFNRRGILMTYLQTPDLSSRKIHCSHACHNGTCSNPRHMYWGTSSENAQDKMISPRAQDISKNLSAAVTGEKNPMFGIKPWRNVCGLPEQWKKAEYLYNEYFLKDWDRFKYGQGKTYFFKKYEITRGPYCCMFEYFESGWKPLEDKDWVADFK